MQDVERTILSPEFSKKLPSFLIKTGTRERGRGVGWLNKGNGTTDRGGTDGDRGEGDSMEFGVSNESESTNGRISEECSPKIAPSSPSQRDTGEGVEESD